MATKLGVSRALVGHFEQGKYSPEREQILAMMALYGRSAEDANRLADLAGWESSGGSWLRPWERVIPAFFRRYVGAEGFARRQFRYAPLVLPSLLQTEAYSAGMTAPSSRVRADEARPLVNLRLARQKRLLEGDLHLTAVIEEDVLDRPAGTRQDDPVRIRAIMQEQYEYLVTMAALPNVDVLILPTDVGRHDGLEGRFTVLHFETDAGERQAGPIVYIEIPNDGVYKTNQDQVAAYTASSDLIASAALSPEESVRTIESRLAA